MTPRNPWKIASLSAIFGLFLLAGGYLVYEWIWQGRVAFAWLAQPAPQNACPSAAPCSRAEALDLLLKKGG